MNLRSDIDEIQLVEKLLHETEHLKDDQDLFMVRYVAKNYLKDKGFPYVPKTSVNMATSKDMEMAGGVSE